MKNLSIRKKLIIMVILPVLLALSFIIKSIFDSYEVYVLMDKASNLNSLAVSANGLVHELQKERGATAGFLGSKGTKFTRKLEEQRFKTSAALNEYHNTVAEIDSSSIDSKLALHLNTIESSLQTLSAIRQQVSSQSIASADAIHFYTMTNTKLLHISSLMMTLVKDSELANKVSAYFFLLQSKERAGIERAALSGVFSEGVFEPAKFIKFVTLLAEQNTYMQVFRDYASSVTRNNMDKMMSGTAIDEVNRLRAIALKQSDLTGVDATYWFQMATQRINNLKDGENMLAEQLANYLLKEKESASSTLIFYSILALFAIVSSATIAGYLLTSISGQISSLSQAMQRVKDHSDLTSRAISTSEDELGTLANDFNGMVQALSTLASSVNNASKDLSGMVAQMHLISSEVSSEVQSGLSQTDQVAAAVTEMDVSVQEVAGNCSNVANKSSQAHHSATEGEQLVRDASCIMHELSAEITDSMSIIEQVASDSEQIGSILDVINGVAEQTNLLALNAAIEAARAGENGRGFSVVADEVRNLAHKTAESTSRIQEMIEQLQKRSRKAVQTMQTSKKRASETVSGFEGILRQFEGVTSQFAQVNDMNLLMAAATEQQSTTVNEINNNVINIQQRYHRANDSASQLASTSESLDKVAIHLSGQVSRFIV